jgi:hypothetical protein
VLETLGWGEREIGVELFLGIVECGGHVVSVAMVLYSGTAGSKESRGK